MGTMRIGPLSWEAVKQAFATSHKNLPTSIGHSKYGITSASISADLSSCRMGRHPDPQRPPQHQERSRRRSRRSAVCGQRDNGERLAAEGEIAGPAMHPGIKHARPSWKLSRMRNRRAPGPIRPHYLYWLGYNAEQHDPVSRPFQARVDAALPKMTRPALRLRDDRFPRR